MNAHVSVLFTCLTLFALFALNAALDASNPLPAVFGKPNQDLVMDSINYQDPSLKWLALKYQCSDLYFRKPKNCKRNQKLLKLSPKLRIKYLTYSTPQRYHEIWDDK